MSIPRYVFPDVETISSAITKYYQNDDYFNKSGITTTIASYAADCFANITLVEPGIKIKVATILIDLQRGVNECKGKRIPQVNLDPMTWKVVEMELEETLMDCAKKV